MGLQRAQHPRRPLGRLHLLRPLLLDAGALSGRCLDVDFMHDVIPTTENLAVGIWRIVVKAIAPAELVLIRLWESENNRVEYAGE